MVFSNRLVQIVRRNLCKEQMREMSKKRMAHLMSAGLRFQRSNGRIPAPACRVSGPSQGELEQINANSGLHNVDPELMNPLPGMGMIRGILNNGVLKRRGFY